MHTLFHDCFNPKNTRENHRQIATFTGCIFTGYAFGFFINDYPKAALATIALAVVLIGIKTAQMIQVSPEENKSVTHSPSPV